MTDQTPPAPQAITARQHVAAALLVGLLEQAYQADLPAIRWEISEDTGSVLGVIDAVDGSADPLAALYDLDAWVEALGASRDEPLRLTDRVHHSARLESRRGIRLGLVARVPLPTTGGTP